MMVRSVANALAACLLCERSDGLIDYELGRSWYNLRKHNIRESTATFLVIMD